MFHGVFLQDKDGLMTRDGVPLLDTITMETGKYFFLVLPDTKQIASEWVRDPREFSYVVPYELHSLDELPENFNKMIGRWTYTPEDGFNEWFDVGAWKYNCELSIREMKMELATGADWINVEALRRFEEEVRVYKGEGARPVFAN